MYLQLTHTHTQVTFKYIYIQNVCNIVRSHYYAPFVRRDRVIRRDPEVLKLRLYQPHQANQRYLEHRDVIISRARIYECFWSPADIFHEKTSLRIKVTSCKIRFIVPIYDACVTHLAVPGIRAVHALQAFLARRALRGCRVDPPLRSHLPGPDHPGVLVLPVVLGRRPRHSNPGKKHSQVE